MRSRPSQTTFSNESKLHQQYFAINPSQGEYRQLFPAPRCPSTHSGPASTQTNQLHSRSYSGALIARPPVPEPAQPVPIVTGGPASGAVVPGAAPTAGIHYNLPTCAAGQLIAARRPQPLQLNYHLQLHHLHRQQLPQLHHRHQQQLYPLHNQPQLHQSFSGPIMESPNEHDIAAQQEAAKGYQPALDVS